MPPARATRLAVLVALAAVAVASLLLPFTLAFDPWAWLVWGREIGRLDLDTTGGPSWKPLPVLVTTLIAPAGAAAPLLWLAIARAASLLALVGAYRLGERLAGRWAGALAAGLLVLTPDTGSRFLRLLVEGHSATIGVTFVLWAIVRHLDGARSQALLLLFGFALIRPEAWPFLGLYAAWLWWREPPRRALIAAVLLAIPVLWLGGDWWGSGSPWHGADAAQVASGGTVHRLTLALERAWKVVPLPVWIAAAVAVLSTRRRTVDLVLAGAAVAWTAIVVTMAAALGYAALSRFYLPAGALLCVLAGAGVVRAVRLAPTLRRRLAGSRPAGRPLGETSSRATTTAVAGAAIALVSLPALLPRVTALDVLLDEARTRHRLSETLDEAIDEAGGREAVLACGIVALDQSGLGGPLRPGLAWKLDAPLHLVERRVGAGPGVLFARPGGREEARLLAGAAGEPEIVARSADWIVYAVGCPPPTGN